MININNTSIIHTLRQAFPDILAIYGFGSLYRGYADDQSDVDLAILIAGLADKVLLWQTAQDLAGELNQDVDLLDLRRASTVMQYQIITTGIQLWGGSAQVGIYECFILSEKTALDTARAGLLEDITARGYIYDR